MLKYHSLQNHYRVLKKKNKPDFKKKVKPVFEVKIKGKYGLTFLHGKFVYV